ncbi:histidine phosphatase family protein [Longispora albida]|uniref:histidine phosphatase family protein n=1 Tax=Longispora albida TaxID=203523 RepID=UPI00037313D7|nr:histidine phosphatase family protein [Longispora albida]
MSIELIYETHSVTEDNEAGIATGWLPGKLSAYGVETARELGARHRDAGTTAVYTSDLARAAETVSIAFAGTGIPVYFDARLRECCYGDLDGAPAKEVEARRLQHVTEPFPGGGQSYAEIIEATREFLAELSARWPAGSRVVLIGHSAQRWALPHLLDGADFAEVMMAPFTWQPGWRYTVGT